MWTDPLPEYVLKRARGLRRRQTDAEKQLWKTLRSRHFESYKFRRQKPIGPYYVDFVCLEQKLIIEIDGGQHGWQQKKDEQRTVYLNQKGFKVIRFWNNDILENLEGVMTMLKRELEETLTPSS